MHRAMWWIVAALPVAAGETRYFRESKRRVAAAGHTYFTGGGTRIWTWRCDGTAEWDVVAPNAFRPGLRVEVYNHAGPWAHLTGAVYPDAAYPNTTATVAPCPFASAIDPQLAVGLSSILRYGPYPCEVGAQLLLKVTAEGPVAVAFGRPRPAAIGHQLVWSAYDYYAAGMWAHNSSPAWTILTTVAIIYALKAHKITSDRTHWGAVAQTLVVIVWFSGLATDVSRFTRAVVPSLKCTPLSQNAGAAWLRGGSAGGVLLARVAVSMVGMATPVWGGPSTLAMAGATALLLPGLLLGTGYVAGPLVTIAWCYYSRPPGARPAAPQWKYPAALY